MNLAKQFHTITNTVALTAALSLTLAANNANARTVPHPDELGINPSRWEFYQGKARSTAKSIVKFRTFSDFFPKKRS